MKRKSRQTTSATDPPYETSNGEDAAKGVVNGEVKGEVKKVGGVEVSGVNGNVI
jgi:hypothetical protein